MVVEDSEVADVAISGVVVVGTDVVAVGVEVEGGVDVEIASGIAADGDEQAATINRGIIRRYIWRKATGWRALTGESRCGVAVAHDRHFSTCGAEKLDWITAVGSLQHLGQDRGFLRP